MEISSPREPDAARPSRILSLDFGSKRIGLAVSDELGVTAQGLPTLLRTNKRNDLDHLRRLIKQYGVSELVIGLPLRMSGEEGIQSGKVQEFAELLRGRFKLPVHLFDERLTSVEANRVLRESEMGIRRRAEVVDQLAAVLILQAFLEFRGHSVPKHRASENVHLSLSSENSSQTRCVVSVGGGRLVCLGGAVAGDACARQRSCCCGPAGRPSTSPANCKPDGIIRSSTRS